MNYFLRYTILNFFLVLKNIITAPFSKLSRHRLSAAYLDIQYPFFGDNYVPLSKLIKNDELMVTLSPVKSRIHNTSEFELLSVCSLLKDNCCNTVFEIGTFDGRTTKAMAMNLANNNGKIYTLNLPASTEQVSMFTSTTDIHLAKKVASGERFINTDQQKYIEQLWGDSASFDFSPYYNSIDLVFIDGAHSINYAENDTFKSIKLIKNSGGLIIWHDAHLFGVVKFLQPWVRKNKLPIYFIQNTSLAIAWVKDGQIFDYLRK